MIRDPVATPILARRVEAIVREMSSALLRSARSSVIAAAKDFSCALLTHDDRLIAAAEGLPVHVLGCHLQTRAMRALHPNLRDGDAFLHNDPYLGNTHAADHAILVPVFVDGRHMFTACAKAHQADIGNSQPTTYHAFARDVYEEGALIFPCVLVERDGAINDDIVRMCERRIRVPEQWRGDFLALIGAARIGERRLKALCASHGAEAVAAFVEDWLDYAEQRMARAIAALPAASLVSESAHDPVEPILPDGIPVRVGIAVEPEAARITVDLRDNIDCVDCGLNQTEACCLAHVFTAVFNCLDDDVPRNEGAFRRVRVLMREGCVVGPPSFPHSCSVSTTNVAERLIYAIHSGFARLGEGRGLAEGSASMGGAMAVISGADARRGGAPFVNQLFLGVGGGPAAPGADGWLTYCLPTAAGLVHLDSVELAHRGWQRRGRAPAGRAGDGGGLRPDAWPRHPRHPVGRPPCRTARRAGRRRRDAGADGQDRPRRPRDGAAELRAAHARTRRAAAGRRRGRGGLRRSARAGAGARAAGRGGRLGDTRPGAGRLRRRPRRAAGGRPARRRYARDRGPAPGAQSARAADLRDCIEPITMMTKAASISAAAAQT